MCGIFGQITNNPKRINDGNIKILGIANIERGRNSCGITMDGKIQYGLEKERLFDAFIKGKKFKPAKYPVVFGHTRQSSVGVVNEANAHPFGFGENSSNSDEFRMIGAHNGTLYNHEELAIDYEIDRFPSFVNQYDVTQTRTKIDSEILLEIIYKTKNFKVLSEYNGGAALVWTDTEDPNVVYLYSGASKEYSYSTKEEIERPLFVYLESRTNMYFSSLSEPLELIGGELGKNVFQIDNNVVFKIRNGNFAHAERFEISRLQRTSKKPYGNYGASAVNTVANNVNNSHTSRVPAKTVNLNEHSTVNTSTGAFTNIRNLSPYFQSIYDFEGRVYERNLRYYRSGTPVTGIFIFIRYYGLFKMESNIPSFEKSTVPGLLYQIFDMKKGTFTGEYASCDTDECLKENEIVPFTNYNSLPTLMYIIEGVRVKTELDFTATLNQARFMTPMGYNHESLSHISVGPVLDIHKQFTPANDQGIIKDGKPFTGSYTDVSYGRLYSITDGSCTTFVKYSLDGMTGSLTGLIEYNRLVALAKEATDRGTAPKSKAVVPVKEVEFESTGIESLIDSEFNSAQMTDAIRITTAAAEIVKNKLKSIATSNEERKQAAEAQKKRKKEEEDAHQTAMLIEMNKSDEEREASLLELNASLEAELDAMANGLQAEVDELVIDAFTDVMHTLAAVNDELDKYDKMFLKNYKDKLIKISNIISE